MYNNKRNTSFPPIIGGNYNLEYSNGKNILGGNVFACSDVCTGVCTIECTSVCANCVSAGCTGGCKTTCTGGCNTGCTDACKGCTASCKNNCTGCDGCSGCASGCYTGCYTGCSSCGGCDSGCYTSCYTGCQGFCKGSGAKVGITGSIKTARFYNGINETVKQSSTQYISINGIIKQI